MRIRPAPTLTVLLALGPAGLAAQGALDISIARFRRPADSVLVQTVVRVPAAALDQVPGTGGAAYRCTVFIIDAGGREVRWETQAARLPLAELRRPGAAASVRPEFLLADGKYRVFATVTDSGSGRQLHAEGMIEPLSEAAPVSDVLLEPRPDAPGPLAYYLELYSPDTAAAGRLWLRVEDSTGVVRWFGPPQYVTGVSGAAARRGAVDLHALGPGGYRLVATADFGNTQETREVTFDFAPPAVSPAAAPLRDTFALATAVQLDSMYGPLLYLMEPAEQGVYPALPVMDRRAFLRAFWSKRDPTPGTPRNEAQEDFTTRLREVNRRFNEGGAVDIPGWRTDRGRVFLRNGGPDLVVRRPPGPRTAGYEVWKYSRGEPRKYVFLDLTRFGNYTLIWSNDPAEPSRPNWMALLGAEAAEDAIHF